MSKAKGLLPPTEFSFGTLLIREFLLRLKKLGYCQKGTGAVHVTVFGRYLRRLVDCLDPLQEIDWTAFGSNKDKVWLSWADIRPGVVQPAVQPVKISCVERILLLLEDPGCCWLAGVYGFVMFVAIISSVALVIIQSMKSICPTKKCYPGVETACVLLFSFDYFARALCAPYSRAAIFDRDVHMKYAAPDETHSVASTGEHAQMTPLQRLRIFLFKPMNMIDFFAILPFWLTLFFSNLIPFPLAFLRALRLLRFLRIMKIGKFDSTLLVLGTTLANSTQSVQVLMIYLCLISLVAGAMLNQVEEPTKEVPAKLPEICESLSKMASNASIALVNNPAPDCSPRTELVSLPFANVPNAAWYVFARMMGMRHSVPWVGGLPATLLGSIVVFICLIMKGIIWVLPFGQIGQTFKDTWEQNQELQQIRKEVETEDTRSPDLVWIEDGGTPVANIEVWGSEEDGSRIVAGAGRIPIPLLNPKATSAEVTTCLWGGAVRQWFGAPPSMDVKISWHPVEVKDGTSKGRLRIEPREGRGFLSSRWLFVVRVPVRLYGEDAEREWQSPPSTESTTPEWPDSTGATFEVLWEEEQKAAPGPEKDKPAGDAELLDEVLTMLETQGRQLQDLCKNTASLDQRTKAIRDATHS